MKKILFYGNCHLFSIIQYFKKHLADKYELIKCNSTGLLPFSDIDELFSPWHECNIEVLDRSCDAIHQAVADADIFIFQEHTQLPNVKLNTNYLATHVAKNLKICIANSRLYCYANDSGGLRYIFKYVTDTLGITESLKTIDYVLNSDDPVFYEILDSLSPAKIAQHPEIHMRQNYTMDEKLRRTYENYISMLDFIEAEYKNKFLFVSHNHPSMFYSEELIIRLLALLGEPYLGISPIDCRLTTYYNPLQFNFFEKFYRGIEFPHPKSMRFRFNKVLPTNVDFI